MARCSICQIEMTEGDAELRGQDLLQQGRSILAAAKRSGSYQDYNRALLIFETASEFSRQDDQTREGLAEAKLAYAEATLKMADFDLGLGVADSDNPAHSEVIARLRAGRNECETRRRRRMILRIAVLVLWLGGCTVVSAFALVKKREAEVQRDRAIANEIDSSERARRAEEEARRLAADAAAKTQVAE